MNQLSILSSDDFENPDTIAKLRKIIDPQTDSEIDLISPDSAGAGDSITSKINNNVIVKSPKINLSNEIIKTISNDFHATVEEINEECIDVNSTLARNREEDLDDYNSENPALDNPDEMIESLDDDLFLNKLQSIVVSHYPDITTFSQDVLLDKKHQDNKRAVEMIADITKMMTNKPTKLSCMYIAQQLGFALKPTAEQKVNQARVSAIVTNKVIVADLNKADDKIKIQDEPLEKKKLT